MRLSRGKSIDSLPRGVLASVSNYKNASGREIDENIAFFGVSLETVMKRDSENSNEIPSMIEKMFNHLEEKEAHKIEGIFRVCGTQSSIDSLLSCIDSGRKDVNLNDYDIHVIANCLKYYFQVLPEPVLTIELSQRFISAQLISDKNLRFDYLNCLISSLPKTHFKLCKRLVLYFNNY